MKRRGFLKGLLASAAVAPALPAIVEAAPVRPALNVETLPSYMEKLKALQEPMRTRMLRPPFVTTEEMAMECTERLVKAHLRMQHLELEHADGHHTVIARHIVTGKRTGPD